MIEIQTSYVTLPYKVPVPVRGVTICDNRFLKVTLLGVEYFISVLPKFHEATLEEIAFKINYFFKTYTLNFNSIDFTKKFFNLVTPDDFINSIHSETLFNIESLLLGMLQKTHHGLFSPLATAEIKVNDLYRASLGPRHYGESKCLKIKIAPKSVEKTIRLLNELHIHNKNLILRLDGNRLFELHELVEFEKTLKSAVADEIIKKIDYIEEPFKNFSDTYLFQKRSDIKIAIDESFSTLINLKDLPSDTPVVIKPSLYGISPIYNWMLTHTKNRSIVSSSFEHPSVKIGLNFLAQKYPSEFHGLENFL